MDVETVFNRKDDRGQEIFVKTKEEEVRGLDQNYQYHLRKLFNDQEAKMSSAHLQLTN